MNFLYYRTLANLLSSRGKVLYQRSTMVRTWKPSPDFECINQFSETSNKRQSQNCPIGSTFPTLKFLWTKRLRKISRMCLSTSL